MHGAILIGLLLTPVPPASAWSASTHTPQGGERHVVQVTLMMSMTNLATQPAQTKPTPQEQIEPAPLTPVAVPASDQAQTQSQPSGPTAAKPPTPDEPIPADPNAKPQSQPVALDQPNNEPSDSPPRDALSQADQAETPDEKPDPVRQALARDPDEKTAESNESAERTDRDKSKDTSDTLEKTQSPKARTTEPLTDAELAEQAQEANDATPQGEEQVEEQAEAQTQEQQESTAPAARVYDEDSVDKPIAFDKKTRPKLSIISKRLGESGTVRILIEIDSTGKMVRHEVLDDAGHPRLLSASLSALQDSTFQPAMREDRAVSSTRVIEYRF